jgi:polyhydroxyalkanoate synthesis regulator phasin
MIDTATEARLQALESAVNEIQTAITNLASLAQLRQLNLIKQDELDALKTRVDTLESEIQVLQKAS